MFEKHFQNINLFALDCWIIASNAKTVFLFCNVSLETHTQSALFCLSYPAHGGQCGKSREFSLQMEWQCVVLVKQMAKDVWPWKHWHLNEKNGGKRKNTPWHTRCNMLRWISCVCHISTALPAMQVPPPVDLFICVICASLSQNRICITCRSEFVPAFTANSI